MHLEVIYMKDSWKIQKIPICISLWALGEFQIVLITLNLDRKIQLNSFNTGL